jgi:hypothetical protein
VDEQLIEPADLPARLLHRRPDLTVRESIMLLLELIQPPRGLGTAQA